MRVPFAMSFSYLLDAEITLAVLPESNLTFNWTLCRRDGQLKLKKFYWISHKGRIVLELEAMTSPGHDQTHFHPSKPFLHFRSVLKFEQRGDIIIINDLLWNLKVVSFCFEMEPLLKFANFLHCRLFESWLHNFWSEWQLFLFTFKDLLVFSYD